MVLWNLNNADDLQHECPEYSDTGSDEDESCGIPSSEVDERGTEGHCITGYGADGTDGDGFLELEECLKCDREFTTYGGMVSYSCDRPTP